MLDPLKHDNDSARVLSKSTCCVRVALALHFERVFTLFTRQSSRGCCRLLRTDDASKLVGRSTKRSGFSERSSAEPTNTTSNRECLFEFGEVKRLYLSTGRNGTGTC